MKLLRVLPLKLSSFIFKTAYFVYRTMMVIHVVTSFPAVQIYSPVLWVLRFEFVVLRESSWDSIQYLPGQLKKAQIADAGGISCMGGSWGTLSLPPLVPLRGLCHGVSLNRNHKFPPQTKKLRNPKTCKRKSEFFQELQTRNAGNQFKENLKLKGIYLKLNLKPGEKGCCSGGSTLLKQHGPGLIPVRYHMHVEFVTGLSPCSKGLYLGISVFLPLKNTNILKCRLDQD